MTERDRLFLGHILDAIAAIASFTAEGRSYFMSDLKTQSAVVRQIEIIGEAVKNLSADLDAVWSMIEQDLPPLKQNTRRILGLN